MPALMRKPIRCVLAAGFLLICSTALADKIDDFREAVGRKGCDSIPYTDTRNHCRSQQSDVHPWCDGARGPVSCDPGVTRKLKGQLESEKRNLDTIKDRRREAEDKRFHASDDAEKNKWQSEIETIDKEIDATNKRLEDLKSELEKRKDTTNKTIETINKCIDYRRAVMNVFADATDKVRNEQDPDIRPYAIQLRDKYSAEVGGHEVQIRDRNNAIEICKDELP